MSGSPAKRSTLDSLSKDVAWSWKRGPPTSLEAAEGFLTDAKFGVGNEGSSSVVGDSTPVLGDSTSALGDSDRGCSSGGS